VQGTAVSCEPAPTAAPINTATGAGIDQDTAIGSIFAAGDRSAPPLVSFVVREGDRDTDWDRVTLDVRHLCSCTHARRNGRLLMHCRSPAGMASPHCSDFTTIYVVLPHFIRAGARC
jgi:hypothetical protein